MVEEIMLLISERGSRTKIRYLQNTLDDTLREAVEQHENLMLLLTEDDGEFNDVWIDELSLRVNSCSAEINKYLSDRESDTLSTGSSTNIRKKVENWREESVHLNEINEETEQRSSLDITDAFSKLQIEPHVGNIDRPGNVGRIRRSTSLLDFAQLNRRFESLKQNTQRLNHSQLPLLPGNTYDDHWEGDPNLYLQDPDNTDSRFRNYSGDVNQELYQSQGSGQPLKQVTFLDKKLKETSIDNPMTGFDDHLHSTYIVQDTNPSRCNPNTSRFSYREKENYLAKSTVPRQTKTSAVDSRDDLKQRLNDGISSSMVSSHRTEPSAVDAWIDTLSYDTINITSDERVHDIQMQMLIQQRLPPQKLPIFDGTANKWVLFISSFFDMVHKQPYLDVFQKRTYLIQHLVGEPKKAIEGFANDADGYIASLKRLKYFFGNPSLVAQATIQKVINGNQLPEYDLKALTEFYYSLSTCLNTLTKMKYTADIYSTDVLRQTLRRLPNHLLRKWAEYSFTLRQREEPTLIHLEHWLQARVMAAKDPYLPIDKGKRTGPRVQRSDLREKPNSCPCCDGAHYLYKCDDYKSKSDAERLNFVKSKQLCFNCLGSGHGVKNCSSKRSCFIHSCNKRHHTSIHQALLQGKSDSRKDQNKTKDGGEANTEAKSTIGKIDVTKKDRDVFLQIVPIVVSNKRGTTIKTYALLDSGSQCTIITKGLCQSLQLPGKLKKVQFGTVKDEETMSAKIVNLSISSADGNFVSEVRNVYSLHENNFNVPGQHIPITEDPKWNYIRDLKFPEVKPDQVQVLIGADVPAALLANEVRKGASGLPYATKTPLGWTLVGVYDGNASGSVFLNHIRPKVLRDDDGLDNLVKQFWETESFGTEFQLQKPMSVNDQRLLKLLDDETRFEDGHYVVPMLWKSDNPLPDSSLMASKRFSYLTKRFQRDESYFDKYKENIVGYLQSNFARKLTKEEASKSSDKTWYLPHHGVINENKPGKVRMVFDAASRVDNQSLNSSLSTGPDLLNSLLGVLLRFRKHRIAVIADVEKMFYQVRLRPEDTDSLRFLWKDNPSSNDEPDHYKMLVHILGATSSPCCASYALRRAISDQTDAFPADIVKTLLRNFYVDDLLSSVANEDKGKELIACSEKLMANRGFNLTKYNSNSEEVLKSAPVHKRAPNTSIEFENTITRALGVKWDLKEDCFLYNVNAGPTLPTYTKRQILKKSASIFDPLGFLAPFTLKAKLILQELWRLKLGWDEPVDDNIKGVWKKWLDELLLLSESIRIPRSLNLIPGSFQSVQLHLFCDASEKAFAAVAYVRVKECDVVRSHIIMAKTRVAPLKRLTLPRLELQGAVMAVRLMQTITKEFDYEFEKILFWTDSTLNLQCINNEDKRFKTFVANRLSEIREHSDANQWKFVPGKLNPADVATREEYTQEANNDVWFNGPTFLRCSETEWPARTLTPLDKEFIELTKVNHTHTSIPQPKKGSIIEFDRFSSWRRIVRIVAWIFVFYYNCKLKHRSIHLTRDLTISEEEAGELKVIKILQCEYFSNEINLLRNGALLKGHLSKLDFFLDKEGIIRVGGRLKHGNFPYASKHQIVLPAKHPAVGLLGSQYHNRHHHVGKEHLLSLLRQRYWVIGGRVMCKQIIKKCIVCQKMNAKPSCTKMANLPEDRISMSTPPFYHTGIDYFGPITVKVLRSRVKRWGCIFTCLSTRAIHLEVAPSLESDDFINVLERFICRRGRPKTIRSDCGTNFIGASNELKREMERLNTTKIGENLRQQSIEWLFNPPESPHMGGVWERMVRSVKTSLNATIMAEGVSLNDFTLMTVLTEVEALVNSRPITPVSDDVKDMEALTPNHFIMGRASTALPTCVTYDDNVTPRRRWKQVQSISQQFWDRWRKEYLPTLTTRSKWRSSSKNVQVGDLVLVKDLSALVRGKWSLARINDVFPSRDGNVRKVEVSFKGGRYVRPVTSIAPLEMND